MRQRHRPDRQPETAAIEVEPLRPADHETEVPTLLPALLEPLAEPHRIESLAIAGEQNQVGAVGDPPAHVLVLADLGDLHPGLPREQLVVVLHVVHEGRAQPADRDDGDLHGRLAILDACPKKKKRTASATSTSIQTRRRWRATTRTSPTSPTRTTNSRSPSRASTTRSRRARCPAWWSRGSTSPRVSCVS